MSTMQTAHGFLILLLLLLPLANKGLLLQQDAVLPIQIKQTQSHAECNCAAAAAAAAAAGQQGLPVQ
jgi:hypothetical protein